jgi:gluconolactonase
MPIAWLAALALGMGASLTIGPVEKVADGFRFTEGPAWSPQHGLLFSDIPASIIYKEDKTPFRTSTGQANGLTIDPRGRVLAAEHETRRISRTEADGTVVALAERFEDKRFNSPNDVIVRSDGTVFFTDPPYGLPGGLDGPNGELHFAGVFAVLPDGAIKALGRDFITPNGIALDKDEKQLYVSDTLANHIRVFDVAADATLGNGRIFHELPEPDGMRFDVAGNLWCACLEGIRVLAPDGKVRETLGVPQSPSNCTFGGPGRTTLYITAQSAVYKVHTAVAGLRPFKESK